jgi:hypothetical protein
MKVNDENSRIRIQDPDPDPPQNVMDPEHWFNTIGRLFSAFFSQIRKCYGGSAKYKNLIAGLETFWQQEKRCAAKINAW